VYPVIGLPPLVAGADQLTEASAVPAWALTFCDALGAAPAVGVTEFDAAGAGPEPFGFDAVTLNVYALPGVKPLTVVLVTDPDTDVGVCAVEPTYGVTVFPVTGPPFEGADHDTVAAPGPAVAVTFVGWPGAAVGVNMRSTE
jgi:hypothetical protein